jgi:putative ABC transport system permease protein
MTAWTLSYHLLKAKLGQHVLTVLLMTLGVILVMLVVHVASDVRAKFQRDQAGVDVVVGATGSGLQLVLAALYHLDAPVGNIPMARYDTLAKHPQVKRAVPIALGDSIQNVRLVGTSSAILDLYNATLAEGVMFDRPFEAVIGAEVARLGFALGQKRYSIHGFSEASGHVHDTLPFTIVGQLAPTGTVLDRLILTSVESYWLLHDTGTGNDTALQKETTAILVQLTNPAARYTLMRQWNALGGLQAASPVDELVRFMRMVGVGKTALYALGALIIGIGAFSFFVSLSATFRQHQADFAELRLIGCSRWYITYVMLGVMMWLASVSLVLAWSLAQVALVMLDNALPYLPVTTFHWQQADTLMLLSVYGLGVLAVAYPAWRSYCLPVTTLLQR